MAQKICLNCGYVGAPRTRVKGSCLIEGILWLTFIVPGIIYTIWRMGRDARLTECPKCGAQNMVPVESPAGQNFLKCLKP